MSVDDDGLRKKIIKLILKGEFQRLKMSCSGQKLSLPGRHKVFNWIDVESKSSIWLMQSLGQSETDTRSGSD